MWFDEYPYVMYYVVGCIATFFLLLFKLALFSIIAWITKGNILAKNLKKLSPPDTESVLSKMTGYVVIYLFEIALSWISFFMGLWQLVNILLKEARELFSSVPEEVKLIRFPLRNNPDMSREAVWAHVKAANLKCGAEWNEGSIRYELSELVEHYPMFNRTAAIKVLEGLNVVNPDVTKELLEWSKQAATP